MNFDASLPFRSYSAYLKERFGQKVHRIALDAGFGCPHRQDGRGTGGCIYCGPAGSGSSAHDQKLSVREQMRQGIERLEKQGVRNYVAYFQAFCNTAAPADRLKRLYREAVTLPGVVGLSVGTRPDLVSDEVLDLIRTFSEGGDDHPPLDAWLELGLQSAHDETLALLNRGHDVACFDDGVARAHDRDLPVAAHVILGLPGEDKSRMTATAQHLAGLNVEGVKLHHLFVEKETVLAERFLNGEVKTLAVDEYIDLAIGFIRRLGPDTVLLRLAGKGSDRLIAPLWRESPGTIAQKLAAKMVQHGWKQGDLFREGE